MNTATHLSSDRIPDTRVLPAVWKLLFMRLRITFNGFRHAKLRRKIGMLFIWLLLLGLAVFILSMSQLLLGLMRSPEFVRYLGVDVKPILASIPALTLSILFVGTLLTSFGVLLQALYLSGDMDFLLATPVPIRAVFVAKLLQAVLPNFALVSLFGLPLLFGLGIFSSYSILYYPLVLIVMIVLALAAAGLSSLLVMLVVRVLPPRRAAEILGFIGAIIGLSCSQLGNVANSFGKVINISGTRLAAILLISNTRWLPLNWAGQGLVALGEGHWLSSILLLSATFGFAIVTFWFALVTAEGWYYSGWAGMQVVTRKKTVRSPRQINADASNSRLGLARLLPKPVLAIVQKDFLTLRRDLRNLSQLISPLILGAIYTLSILRNSGHTPAGNGDAPSWFMDSFRIMLAYSSVGMSLFVGWMILSRLAGMGFSHEGKNYWMLKVSPIRVGHLLMAKFLVAYIPALGLGFVFLTVISVVQKLSLLVFLYSLIAIIMCLAGMTGILLAFGVAGANFTWDDPRKINAGTLGCLGQIITMLSLPISFSLFIAPLGLAQFFNFPLVYGYLIGLIVGSGVAIGFIFIPLRLVRKRTERLDEA
jgi:ABC-2 type transport system permease protein